MKKIIWNIGKQPMLNDNFWLIYVHFIYMYL